MNILTDSAKVIVEKVINFVIGETYHICCFKCISDDYQKEKQELEASWTTIGKDVEDARRRAEDIRDDVTYWQGQAEKLIKEDAKTKMPCFKGWCPNCIARYHSGKELSQKTADIRRLKGANFDSVGRVPHLPGVEYHSSQGFVNLESRDLEYNQLRDALVDDNNYITGLQGMGGTGKTTLAKQVGKKLKESGNFDHVIFTAVSSTPDIKKIQDSIAGPLGLSLKEMNEWERRSILWKRLTDGEKILIILDDVWDRISFEEIGVPSSENHNNCRLLLTTRDVRVCSSMGCPRPIQLGLLPEQDAWILFKKLAAIEDDSSKDLQDKGQEITKECNGLPVAIAAIASTLKDRLLEEWNAALTALRNPTPMRDVNENLMEVYKCLKYSYDNMKSEKAKILFVLFSIFPEDIEVPIEMLTRIGAGVGLFEEVDKYYKARNQVVVAKNKLIDSCLLLEGEKRCVKMHDLVREVALWLANQEIQVINLSDINRKALAKNENIRYLCCLDLQVRDMDVFPNWFNATELEILLINMEATDSVQVPNAFFEEMTRLRVFFFTHKALEKLDLLLPFSVQSLTNIRSIFLDDWKLGDLSFLGALQSLETLDLEDCSISELPNELTKLEKLRLLRLEDCEIERNNPFEVIQRCLSLEELYFNKNKLSTPDSVNEAGAIHQSATFPAWSRYHIQIDEEMDEDSISKCVCLPNIDAWISEATFKYLVQGAEIVRLKEIEGGWRNLIPDIVPMEDEGMNDLVELGLESCSKVECLVNNNKHIDSRVVNVFSKLVALKLESMDNLKELCSGALPFEFLKSLERLHIIQCGHLQGILFKSKLNLCNLKMLKLEGCPMLTSLFQLSTARSLLLLEELRIRKCEQLTGIITDERSEGEILDDKNDQKSYGSLFPKLKTLNIRSCHRLECILAVLFPGDIPLLETIKIDDCGELKHVFGQCQHQDVALGSLQKVSLSRLPSFVNIYQECHPPMSSSVKRSSSINGSKVKHRDPGNRNVFHWSCICCHRPKLRSATSIKMRVVSTSRDGQIDCSISSMLNSECLHPIECAECLPTQSQGLNILIMRYIREIELKGLDKIKHLFMLSTSSSMKVEILRIKACPRLKHIIDINGDDHDRKTWGVIFPNLKELSVYDCGQLEYMFGLYPLDQSYSEAHIHLPALEKLILGNLPNFFSICPKSSPAMTWPCLKEFHLVGCPLFTVTSVSDFMVDLDTRQLDCALRKDLGELVMHGSEISNRTAFLQAMLNVEKIVVEDSKIEGILQLPAELATNRKSDVFTSCLRELNLVNLPELMYICKGPIQSMSLQNLERVMVYKCNNLKCILSSCVAGGLPQLKELNIERCHKLEQILQDEENQEFLDLPMESYQLEDCPTSTSKSSVTLQITGPFNLCCLRRLTLRSCLMLRSMFSPSTAISLTSLEELRIEECHGLRYLVADDRDHKNEKRTTQEDHDSRSYVSMFPKLKAVSVKKCNLLEYIFHVSCAQCLVELKDIEICQSSQLRYVFGQNTHSSHDYQNKIPIELPALEKVTLQNIPNMISICPDNCYVTCSSLRLLDMDHIGLFTLSINDLMVNSGATHVDHSSTAGIGAASMKKGRISRSVTIRNISKMEGIFNLEGFLINGQEVTSWLTDLNLADLPLLSYIWRGAQHFVSLQNLYKISIWGCPKLKAIFSASVLRSLPLLKILVAAKCEELKQIIEEDEENENVSNSKSPKPKICFPQLKLLIVTHCDNLKRLFYISTPHKFPELEFLIINQDSRLEQVFEGAREGRAKVLLPKLSHVVLMKLPNLNNINLPIEFETLTNLLVHNCPKLSLTSTTNPVHMLRNYYYDNEVDFFVRRDLLYISNIITRETTDKDPMPEMTSPLHMSLEVQAASESELPSSQVNGSNQFMPLNLAASGHEHNQTENGTTESESFKFLTSERKNKGTQDLQKLPPILSPNLIENIEEKETAIAGQIPAAIPASDSDLRRPSLTSLETPPHKIPSCNIEDKEKATIQEGSTSEEAMGEPCVMNQQKTLGETKSTIEIPQCLKQTEDQSIQEGFKSEKTVTATLSSDSEIRNTTPGPVLVPFEMSNKRGVEEGTTQDTANVATSSTHSELPSSPLGPLVASQHKSYPHNAMRLRQAEKYTDKEYDGSPINIQDLLDDDLSFFFQPTQEDGDDQILAPSVSVVTAEHPATKDNLVVKVLANLEESLKMPLKDIASSEDNSLRLLTALNFLSRLSLEDVTLSDGLKSIIDSLHQEVPGILCSFKQAFAIANKFAVLEEKEKSIKEELTHRNEAAITTLVSKISKAKNFMNEAQQKVTILKEQINRWEKDMEDCEADLSSLQEEKKKLVIETIGYKKEFETVRTDKSEMVEDQRKARQELFEVDYKWSALCSQFEHYRIGARNPP